MPRQAAASVTQSAMFPPRRRCHSGDGAPPEGDERARAGLMGGSALRREHRVHFRPEGIAKAAREQRKEDAEGSGGHMVKLTIRGLIAPRSRELVTGY